MTPGCSAVSFQTLDHRRAEVGKSKSSQTFLAVCLGENLLQEGMEAPLWESILNGGVSLLRSVPRGIKSKFASVSASFLFFPRL